MYGELVQTGYQRPWPNHEPLCVQEELAYLAREVQS
jgi:hypothetical protein